MNTTETTKEADVEAVNAALDQELSNANIEGLNFRDAMDLIRSKMKLDPTNQYKSGGKIYQRVARFRPNGGRAVFVSLVVNHTPGSKYTGEKLRELAAKRRG